MNPQKMNSVKTNFIQRRYGVSLGRRYALAAASIMLLSVFGCSSVDNSNNVLTRSYQPGSELSFSSENNPFSGQ